MKNRNAMITEYLPLVYGQAGRISGGCDRETLVSAGMEGLVRAASLYDAGRGSAFASFAIRCIRNEMLMEIRSARKTWREVPLDERLPCRPETEPEYRTLAGIEKKERYQSLIRALEGLSPGEQHLIRLRYGLGSPASKPLSQQETAARLGCSQSYVSRLERRTLRTLRKELEKEIG